jgi:hypothetical protein
MDSTSFCLSDLFFEPAGSIHFGVGVDDGRRVIVGLDVAVSAIVVSAVGLSAEVDTPNFCGSRSPTKEQARIPNSGMGKSIRY